MTTSTQKETPVPKAKAKRVTSTKTVEFTAIGWSIQAGEVKELPASEEAQAEILSKHYITIKN